ncbi:MAG TPA: glutamate--tRNA ligase [Bacteroidales bacterium]|nr:glutamate--tRNA ligase [Bacteroidales bacterium]
MSKIRVRFAPSPTGPLHIGGVRTALYNYLFAKKHSGVFILRIEDTDQTRYVKGAEEYIVESLKWCGIEPDESVQNEGNYGPYKQSERSRIYKEYVAKLIASDNAYYAFDTPEELDNLRKEAENSKTPFVYNAFTREKLKNSTILSKEECEKLIANNTPYVVRFKTPIDKEIVINDLVRGEIKFNSNETDDKVLFKSDGLPTYHLANIVDDHLMQISHVIRGEEWLPSLPLHVMLYEALSWKAPLFAHLPLILKPEGKGKLSKRDGDKMGFPVFPIEYKTPEGEIYRGYREDGYLPEAFINMLALLGWNPGDEREIMGVNELIEEFSIERVGKSGSRFSPEKAKWFNQQYLHKMPDEKLALLFAEELKKHNIKSDFSKDIKICSLLKERISFVSELWNEAYFFYKTPDNYDEKFAKKAWKEDTAEIMTDLMLLLNKIDQFEANNLETKVKEMIAAKELGFGKVMTPFRLALVGAGKGPHVFDIAEIIGRGETVLRIKKAIEAFGNA